MRVLLSCDATPGVGAGRLLRGLAVAEALLARGHEALLSADVTEAWARELVDGASVPLLPPAGSAAELRDLAVDRRADLVHLDGPAPADAAVPLGQAGLVVSQVDDAGPSATVVDLLVTPTVMAPSESGASERTADGRVIATGPQYAPVRAAVVEARERRHWRAGGMGDRLKVVVRLGDPESAEQMLQVVQAVVHSDLNTDVLALAPSQAAARRAESMSTRSVRVLATGGRSDLPRIIADHDLVVTRPGPLLWEVCCIGTPAALVLLTDQDEAAAADWVAAEVAVSLGRPGSSSGLAGQLRALLRDGMHRASMSTAALRLVDGGGAGRVVQLMESVVRR